MSARIGAVSGPYSASVRSSTSTLAAMLRTALPWASNDSLADAVTSPRTSAVRVAISPMQSCTTDLRVGAQVVLRQGRAQAHAEKRPEQREREDERRRPRSSSSQSSVPLRIRLATLK